MAPFSKKSGKAGLKAREKRSAPRFRFTARVDLTDDSTDSMLSGRIVQISQTGCYVNLLSAPPAGTRIRLRITHGLDTFKTRGEIRHVEAGVGMGVQFIDAPPNQLKILSSWIAELTGAS